MLDTLKSLDWSKIDFIIELGTHHGASAKLFKEFCNKVYTVEISEDLYNKFSPELTSLGINCINGHSTDALKEILTKEKGEYFIFFDAHSSQGDTSFHPSFGPFTSPAITEIEACASRPFMFGILDDFRDFQRLSSYPRPEEVYAALKKVGDYDCEISQFGNGQLICRRK